jgi:protein O-mannosyl-transferase
MTRAASNPKAGRRTAAARPGLHSNIPVSFGSMLGVSLALIAINLVIYSPAWHYGFLSWDDPLYISKNAEVARGLTWHSVVWAFTTGHSANWHPLTWLSHMLDVQLYGMAAGFHHGTNVLLHIANTLLLFTALCRMTGAWRRSAIVAAFFAVHPLHVESVAWIAERKDVLSTFFLMLTLHAYIHYVHRPRLCRYLVTIAVFALGLMAKPMLVTLPLILLLLDIWPLRRVQFGVGQRQAWLRLVREKVPFFALAIASSAVTIAVQWRGGTVADFQLFPFTVRLANALVSYIAYIGKAVWPRNLLAYYPYEPLPGLWVIGSILGLISVTAMVIWLRWRFPHLLVGWFWYVCTLLPVIGLIQVAGQARADRYTYVPLIGLFIVAAWGLPEILGSRRHANAALAAAAGILIGFLAVAARNQVEYWESDLALWEHTVQAKSGNFFACTNLGFALADRGNFDGAIAQYTEALRISPTFAETHNALGLIYFKQGRLSEAMTQYAEALRLNPRFVEAHSNLGTVLGAQGKTEEAILEFLKALRIDPDNAVAHYNLGFALADQGRTDEAIAQFREALRINPLNPDAYNRLGNALLIQGKVSEALGQYAEALRIKPDFAEPHYNLGIALMSQQRNNEAIAHLAEAVRIKPGWADAISAIGLALANSGRNDEAIPYLTEALRIDPANTRAQQNLAIALGNQQKTP